MPERLQITKNAQFYAPIETITDLAIGNILDAAAGNMEINSGYVINSFREDKVVQAQELNYKCSIRVFSSTRPVYFINGNFEDKILSFIILIELQGYLAVFKKSCATITETIKQNFNLVGCDDLSGTFDDYEVEFQKISLRNMTISDRAMRARSYEAADLKGLLSTHSAGRSIPYFLKLRQGPSTKTISSTGRLVESSQRSSLDDIVIWAKEQINRIQNPSQNKIFLDSFAKRVELSDVLTSSQPNAILVESSPLHERIEGDGLILKYRAKRRIITVSSRIKNALFKAFENVYELNSDGQIIGKENCSRLRRNDETLTITSTILRKFRIVVHGKEITLQRFIIKNDYYSVTFTNPKYMYFMGSCFEDSSGISEINSILEILHPKLEINTAVSEKGTFTSTCSAFQPNSMFGIIEHLHRNDDYVFCDDLGIEWADHITFNKSESNICFIHSKYGSESTSASNLHEVVGQGIKNLGNMYFSSDQFITRISNKLSSSYKNSGVTTSISRTRKGDVAIIDAYLETLLKDYKLHRKCILNCSFLSKSAVTSEFSKIQCGQPVNGHIIQLLWIISSFAHAVKDVNAIPIIYCKE